ncbi:exodeoxyribonuclease VII large subunit [Halorientalis brevis]|uniref:Exodeoxyribonuclease VII large subunit n=1 Tax=Halorientalis brevis TaxID=1126241 RepID=A0ABD6CEJ1_9EURY|nr:exodeoxyribonuclease VII large subunit [Halorientalis brevis]
MADGAGTDDPHDDQPTLPPDVTDDLPDDADVVTVAELSKQVETLVDTSDGLHHDYILGDISGPSESSSGHLYFTLEGENCELQCVAFNFRRSQLFDDPDDDMRALVQGDLQYYAPRGQLSSQILDYYAVGESIHAQVYT